MPECPATNMALLRVTRDRLAELRAEEAELLPQRNELIRKVLADGHSVRATAQGAGVSPTQVQRKSVP